MVSRMRGKDIVFSLRGEDIFLIPRIRISPMCAHRYERPVCRCAIITFRVFTYRVSLISEFPSTASALFHAKLYRPENICLSSVITPHICSSSMCSIETLAGLSITKGEEENGARRNIIIMYSISYTVI